MPTVVALAEDAPWPTRSGTLGLAVVLGAWYWAMRVATLHGTLHVESVPGQGSNRAIAASLHVSEATVKTHLLHASGKLGVSGRTAAVTAALEQNLIRLDSQT